MLDVEADDGEQTNYHYCDDTKPNASEMKGRIINWNAFKDIFDWMKRNVVKTSQIIE